MTSFPVTYCTKCKAENTWCSLSYPAYAREHVAWKQLPGAKEATCTLCCRCIFKHSYKGRNALSACNCKDVFYGLSKK